LVGDIRVHQQHARGSAPEQVASIAAKADLLNWENREKAGSFQLMYSTDRKRSPLTVE